jgi:dipeptidase E
MTRRILACGGRQLYHPALTQYLFSLARRPRPRVLFLGTASGDSEAYRLTFYQAIAGQDCEPSHLQLFNLEAARPADRIREQDIVMVGGGNTANMLAIWRLHGIDRALGDAYAAGTVLTGWSAGCICWFEAGITDSFDPDLGPLRDGLAFLAGSACPHYDSEERREPVYAREVAAGMPPGIALDDAVAARFDDEKLTEVVSALGTGRAFSVTRSGATALPVRVL